MAASHFAKMAKDQGWDLEAVLNNDIVGGDKSAEQDHSVVRVFSEGVPTAATDQDVRRIRGPGGESDSDRGNWRGISPMSGGLMTRE